MSGFVYAIAAESRVKIGWSSDPMRRLVKIRSDCPVDATLIGVVSATRAQECEIHAELAPWRINGEWFDLSANAVAAFISMLPKAEPKPIRRYGKGRSHPLAQYRAEHGKTLTWVAEQVRCEPSFLSDVERGIKHPGLTLAVKLSELSGVPVERFARDGERAA